MEQFGLTQKRLLRLWAFLASVANTFVSIKASPWKFRRCLNRAYLALATERSYWNLRMFKTAVFLSRQRIVSNRLSVRELENLVFQHQKARKTKSTSGARKTPHLQAIEEELRQISSTKVRIASGPKRGTLHIEFTPGGFGEDL